jgi:hypothetical protein
VRILRNHQCTRVRIGRGDHEVWYSPISRRHFTVDRQSKSRHTANGTLKQAGLPKAF